jgi:phospholipid transport system substrate-binding protein
MGHLVHGWTWRSKIAGLCVALSLAAGVLGASVAALAADPQSSVRSFYATLLATMKDGGMLGQSGRYARLAPVVDRVFDVPSMIRLAIGLPWAALPPAQQQRLTEAFRHYIAATYADRFDTYSGEQLQVTGEQPYNTNVIVQTKIIKRDGETRARGRSPTSISTGRSASLPYSARNSARSSGAKGSTVWSWRSSARSTC